MSLVQDVIDTEYELAYSCGRMALLAPLLVRANDATGFLRTALLNGRAAVPYWTGGRTADELQQDERQAAVDKYNKEYKPILDIMNATAQVLDGKKAAPDAAAAAVPMPVR